MTRILIFGDLAQTGFGTVTNQIGPALLARGDDVRVASLNEGGWLDKLPDWLKGRVMRFGNDAGWLAMPRNVQEATEAVAKIEDIFGTTPWADGWAPDAAIIIGDTGSVKQAPVIRFIPNGFPVLHYVPIEGVDLPPRWASLWDRMEPVAMSEFGADQLALLTGKRPPVVYHGVDTETYHPATPEQPIVFRTTDGLAVLRSKADCKRFAAIFMAELSAAAGRPQPINPEHVWLFRADRNVPRKRYPALLRSLAPVLGKYSKTDFIYHCLTMDQGGDLDDAVSKYRPEIAARIHPTNFHNARQLATDQMLAVLYNAADVYVSNSSEGFGLTIAEALACGTPAVGMDFSSVPEVIGKCGLLVPPGFYDDNIYAHYWAGANEPLFSEAVERLVQSRRARRELGARGPIHVGATFSWARAAEQFSNLITDRLKVAVAA